MYGDVQQASLNQNWNLSNTTNWSLKLCWRPKKCFLSGKQLWGKYAYQGIQIVSRPRCEPVKNIFWIEKNEFIFWNLRK